VEEMVVECIVSLPDRLFYNTGIPACLWLLNRAGKERRKEILFIDAGSFGTMINRRNRELSLDDIRTIAGIYHNWRSGKGKKYKDVAGLCKSTGLEEVGENEYILIPGRYVGIPREEEEDDYTFKRRMIDLSNEITILIKKGAEMDLEILEKIKELGFKA
jgi:type I restriction enzyme M protein